MSPEEILVRLLADDAFATLQGNQWDTIVNILIDVNEPLTR